MWVPTPCGRNTVDPANITLLTTAGSEKPSEDNAMQAASWHGRKLALSLLAVLAAGPPAVHARVAGGAGTRTDCYSEFDGITATPNSHPPRVECVDGDPCDQDGVCGNGFCEWRDPLSVHQNDPDIPVCTPPHDGLATIHVVPTPLAAPAPRPHLPNTSRRAPLRAIPA